MLNRTVYVNISVIAALRSVARATWYHASVGQHADVRELRTIYSVLCDLPDRVSHDDLVFRMPEALIPRFVQLIADCHDAIMEAARDGMPLAGAVFIDDADDDVAPSPEVEAFLRAERIE